MDFGSTYKLPYTLSETAVSLIADVAAALERYKIVMEGPDGVRLRKINYVKTIHGTARSKGVPTEVPIDVPINVPISEAVLELVRKNPGISRTKMAAILAVTVKTIGRALAALPQVEHRGSKRTGWYYAKEPPKRIRK
ncbi:MAG: hypothetical protein IKJ37_05560 [Kiritimatiellae bacterium]|nr:hypothetical protein [Kiritimatiellia bacterium]